VSRVVTLDLDDIATQGIEELVAELRRRHLPREADPKLYADLGRTIDKALAENRITADSAARMRKELDEISPAAMLESNFHELIENRPTIGHYRRAFPRRDRVEIPNVSDWIATDPDRLRGVIAESARFSSDWLAIAENATKLADAAGIPEDVANGIIVDAIRSVRRARASNVG